MKPETIMVAATIMVGCGLYLVYHWITGMIESRVKSFCLKGGEAAMTKMVYAWCWFWIVWILVLLPLGIAAGHMGRGTPVTMVQVLFGLWFSFGIVVWMWYQGKRDEAYQERQYNRDRRIYPKRSR